MQEQMINLAEIILIILPFVIWLLSSLILKLIMKDERRAKKLSIDITALFFVIATNVAFRFYFDNSIAGISWIFLIITTMIYATKSYRKSNEVKYIEIFRKVLRLVFIIFFLLYFLVNILGIVYKIMY